MFPTIRSFHATEGRSADRHAGAAEAIALYPSYLPDRLFTLLGQIYPVPQDKTMRTVPFMPYLSFAPSMRRKLDRLGHHQQGLKEAAPSEARSVVLEMHIKRRGFGLSPETLGYS
jgi:hypothetical protein